MTEIKGAIYPDLEGKAVLITGGGSGIGESIVHHFARQKAKVAFIDINGDAAKKVVADCAAKGWTVHFEHCDLTDIPALQAAIARAPTTRARSLRQIPRPPAPVHWLTPLL